MSPDKKEKIQGEERAGDVQVEWIALPLSWVVCLLPWLSLTLHRHYHNEATLRLAFEGASAVQEERQTASLATTHPRRIPKG